MNQDTLPNFSMATILLGDHLRVQVGLEFQIIREKVSTKIVRLYRIPSTIKQRCTSQFEHKYGKSETQTELLYTIATATGHAVHIVRGQALQPEHVPSCKLANTS
jgi:hypothetical protein